VTFYVNSHHIRVAARRPDPMILNLRLLSAAAARRLVAAGRSAVLVGAFALMSATAHAEACIDSWSTRFGTATLDDQIRAAVRDDAGNVYLGGYEGGKLGVENFWPVGDARGFVEKHGPDGARLWRREFDTNATDMVEALALDASGRVAVAGRTDGTFPGMVNGGQFDLFVALLDGDGNLLSLTQTGDERPQHPAAITLADNGDIVVVGYDDEFVVGTAVIAWQNGFVGRFRVGLANSIDLVSWSASNTSAADLVTSVARASDDSGDVFISTVVSATPARGGGVRVRRVGAQNNVVWSTTLSTLSLDYIATLVVAPGGRLYAAGTTIGQIFGLPLGNSDGFVAELDPATGAPLNSVQIGSVGGDWIFSLAADGHGDLYALGVATDEVVKGFQGNGRAVPFVLTLTADLVIVGGWQHDAPALLAADTMVVVPAGCAGRALVAGSTLLPAAGLTPSVRTDAVVVAIGTLDSIFGDGFGSD
jgi:hypothetical protein